MQTFRSILTAMLIFSIGLNAYALENEATDENTETVEAVWQEHTESFRLGTIYNYYSCNGIEGKVEMLLKELGAKDVKARASGCFDANGQLGNSLRIKVSYKTLSTDIENASETIQAKFTDVHIRPRHPRGVALGDCELIYIMQKNLLDTFDHELIKKNRRCYPGSQSIGDVDWKLKVLKAN